MLAAAVYAGSGPSQTQNDYPRAGRRKFRFTLDVFIAVSGQASRLRPVHVEHEAERAVVVG
ncbi:MAG TPA: hypothetical protein DGB32_02600 [Dehalococcoidia bacterium]|jgi:hypothetical protein|nr:hypothetical protein [Chloroflexota bacterium]HCV27193.1 hypothetical protein [Dehalococcoidia bacterium]|tara:strand:+ start:1347 stop:1529 length:183 start_codon:yes stop_codon:yes gene_type:complete